jgi:hypothetical protein
MNDIAVKFIEETKVIFLESNAENCNKKKLSVGSIYLPVCVCVGILIYCLSMMKLMLYACIEIVVLYIIFLNIMSCHNHVDA